jgi:hypothetical protein
MPHYRLYFLNGRTGSIDRFEEFEAADDDGAMKRIEPRIGDQTLELWSGGRRVGRFDDALTISGLPSTGPWTGSGSRRPDPAPHRRPFGF